MFLFYSVFCYTQKPSKCSKFNELMKNASSREHFLMLSWIFQHLLVFVCFVIRQGACRPAPRHPAAAAPSDLPKSCPIDSKTSPVRPKTSPRLQRFRMMRQCLPKAPQNLPGTYTIHPKVAAAFKSLNLCALTSLGGVAKRSHLNHQSAGAHVSVHFNDDGGRHRDVDILLMTMPTTNVDADVVDNDDNDDDFDMLY